MPVLTRLSAKCAGLVRPSFTTYCPYCGVRECVYYFLNTDHVWFCGSCDEQFEGYWYEFSKPPSVPSKSASH